MKKIHLFIAFNLLMFPGINAQVNYSFSATTATYVPVAGGTTPPLINRPYDYGHISFTYDEGVANNIPIGFTFNYNGVDYTGINICANGFATLGAPFNTDVNTVENFYINNLGGGPLQEINNNCADTIIELKGNTKPVLAPLWDDLNLETDANLRYTTTGSAGSRVFTFEWSNVKWQFDATGKTLSFQLKLYEGTNIIEFCYKDEGGAPSTAASASIGLTASTAIGGGFMSLENTSASPTVSTSVETNTLYKKPANNQVYRFTPLPCPLPINIHYNNFDNTSVNFAWDAPSDVTNFGYAVTTSLAPPSPGLATTSTAGTVSSLSPGTKYYIHVGSYCSASSQSAWSAIPFITTKNISLPPAIEWKKSIGGSAGEGAASVRQTSDGGYIIAGASNSNDGDVTGNHGNADYWVTKVNNTGGIEWQKSYGGTNDEIATSVVPTSDGGYIISGTTNSNDGDVVGNHGDYDYWIVKLNNTGVIQWQKCLGGSGLDWETSIDTAIDGGYIVAGITFSEDGNVTGKHLYFDDYWVVKLSNSGDIQWQKCLGGTDEDRAYTVKHTLDGGYIVAGHSYSTDGDVTGNHGRTDYWIVKLSSSGDIQWQKCLGGSGGDRADIYNVGEGNHIQETFDGGYILAGGTESNDGDLSGHYGSLCKNDLWVVKLSSTGDVQWNNYFGGADYDAASGIEQTREGGYIIAGSSLSKEGDVTGNHGIEDYWILKLDKDGKFQWQKSLGGSNSDRAADIQPTSDNGYIVAGFSESNDGDVNANHGQGDYWIVKLGADAVLPVSILHFSGEVRGEQNLLYWTTATELNNTGFEVQRSSDGNNFNKVGFVTSKSITGNSSSKLEYGFTDMGFSASINYYRLKQIDKDGKFSYSNIVVLKDNNVLSPGLFIIYPNPAKNILNIKTVSAGNNKITLLVNDLNGKLLFDKVINIGNGESIIPLDISQLSAGSYFVKLVCSNGCNNAMKKFVKQ